MRPCSGIDDDAADATPCLVDPVDHLAFMVGLLELDGQFQISSNFAATQLHIRQRFMTVYRRFPEAQHVQVRAVEDQNRLHCKSLMWFQWLLARIAVSRA
ncbi:hypothetical protein D9M71_823640 [compost metagenome]